MSERGRGTRRGRVAACAALAGVLAALAGQARADDPDEAARAAARAASEQPLAYTRIYADVDELSHFDDGSLPLTVSDELAGVPPFAVTALQRGTGLRFLRVPVGWFGDWHPAPRRQLVIVLAGTMQIRVGDGEERRFGPGSVLLAEDTVGDGHTTTAIGTESLVLALVPLVERAGGTP